MVKETFDYESKQAARQKLVNFVIRNYRKDERKNMRMACLPGAEALDVFNISDILGIPRSNVTGIERDEGVYQKLKKMNLGTALFYGTDKEFFQQTNGKYDIISMDYFGMLTPEKMKDLDIIFRNKLLSDRAVLHTNFFGARETERVKAIYEFPFVMRFVSNKLSANETYQYFGTPSLIKQLKEKIKTQENLLKTLESGQLTKLRDGITGHIILAAEIVSLIEVMFNLSHEIPSPEIYVHRDSQKITLESVKNLQKEARQFFLSKKFRPYFCDDVESYKYISDVNSPMLTDIFLFNTHNEWYNETVYPINFNSDGEEIKCQIKGKDYSRFDSFNPLFLRCQKHMLHVAGYYVKSLNKIKERSLLGSSEKPKIDSEKAKKLLAGGVSAEEILKNYRGISKRQLAAFKAWETIRGQNKN